MCEQKKQKDGIDRFFVKLFTACRLVGGFAFQLVLLQELLTVVLATSSAPRTTFGLSEDDWGGVLEAELTHSSREEEAA